MERVETKVNKTRVESELTYVSFDGLEFKDLDACERYEGAVKAVSCQQLISQGTKISEYDLYNCCAGCEEYDYLVVDVNKQNRDLLETLYKLYNVDIEEKGLPMLGEKYVYGLGYVGSNDLTFESFYPYGKAEDFYNELTTKMKEILL